MQQNPFICFISLCAAIPQDPRVRRDHPDLVTACMSELEDLMVSKRDVRFVLIDELRKETLAQTRKHLLSLGYSAVIADRIEDITPRARIDINGQYVEHLVAPAEEIELYLEHYCNRILSNVPHGYAILIDNELYFKYMEPVTIHVKDGRGLSKDHAEKLSRLLIAD